MYKSKNYRSELAHTRVTRVKRCANTCQHLPTFYIQLNMREIQGYFMLAKSKMTANRLPALLFKIERAANKKPFFSSCWQSAENPKTPINKGFFAFVGRCWRDWREKQYARA